MLIVCVCFASTLRIRVYGQLTYFVFIFWGQRHKVGKKDDYTCLAGSKSRYYLLLRRSCPNAQTRTGELDLYLDRPTPADDDVCWKEQSLDFSLWVGQSASATSAHNSEPSRNKTVHDGYPDISLLKRTELVQGDQFIYLEWNTMGSFLVRLAGNFARRENEIQVSGRPSTRSPPLKIYSK
jgi:hypothetical protein